MLGRGVATVIYGDYEWDDEKAAANARKHGVTFEERCSAGGGTCTAARVSSCGSSRSCGRTSGAPRR